MENITPQFGGGVKQRLSSRTSSRKRSITPDDTKRKVLSPARSDNIPKNSNDLGSSGELTPLFKDLKSQLSEEKSRNDELLFELKQKEDLIKTLRVENSSFRKRFDEFKRTSENSVDGDSYKKAIEETEILKVKVHDLEEEKKTSQSRIGDLQQELNSVYNEKTEIITNLETKTIEYEVQEKKLIELRKDCITLTSSLEEMIKKYEECRNECDELKKANEALDEIEANRTLVSESDQSFMTVKSNRLSLSKSSCEPLSNCLEMKLQETEEQLDKVNRENEELKHVIEEQRKKIEEKNGIEHRFSLIINKLSTELSNKKETDEKNERLVEEIVQLRNSYNEVTSNLKSFVEKSTKEKARLMDALKHSLNSNSLLINKVKDKNLKIKSMNEERQKMEIAYVKLQKELFDCDEQLKVERYNQKEVDDHINELVCKINKLVQLPDIITELQQRLNDCEFDLRRARKTCDQNKERKIQLKQKINELIESNNRKEDIITNLTKEVKKKKEEIERFNLMTAKGKNLLKVSPLETDLEFIDASLLNETGDKNNEMITNYQKHKELNQISDKDTNDSDNRSLTTIQEEVDEETCSQAKLKVKGIGTMFEPQEEADVLELKSLVDSWKVEQFKFNRQLWLSR